MERKIEDIVDTLKRAKERGKGCSLLIGAGCSQTAGIPTAGEIVKIIQEKCPREYERSKAKTYPCCMAELPPGERRDLIDGYVRQAKINWGHIAIAQLMKAGYIERVLTTNFDPLVVRACALLGLFPAIYDFAASQYYKRAFIPTPAVFYLHGQHTGFVLMNTEEECKRHSEQLEPLFKDVTQGRVWIVAGYSGENDPVFDHLANMEQFDEGLYWVGYKDNEPPRHVRERLLGKEKYAYYVKGFDSDDLFVMLAQQLGCFPPTFVSRPFSHLNNLLEMIAPYKLPGQDTNTKVPESTQKLIQRAIKRFEKQEEPEKKPLRLREAAATEEWEESSVDLESYLMAGEYDKVITEGSQIKEKTAEIQETIAWAYINQGNTLSEQALTKSGAEADTLFTQAGEKYQAALAIKPDKHEALYNWGNALSNHAKTKLGAEADTLFAQAGKKYQAALTIKPDKYETLYNWGNALSVQAMTKTGAEANALFAKAIEKYQAALAIKPDMHEALCNWGNALSEQAKTKNGAEADVLFAQVGEKYQAALAIKPDMHEALYNWGSALFNQAKTKTGAEADTLFAQVGEKYQAALAIKPDMHEALCNWGNVLSDQALTKTGPEADTLFAQAGEKYQAALTIKPDMHEALNNWGNALLYQVRLVTGEKADSLIQTVREKCLQAEAIKTGSGSYNLACISSLQGNPDECRRWLEKCLEYNTLPDKNHLMTDSDLDNVRNCDWFQELIKGLG